MAQFACTCAPQDASPGFNDVLSGKVLRSEGIYYDNVGSITALLRSLTFMSEKCGGGRGWNGTFRLFEFGQAKLSLLTEPANYSDGLWKYAQSYEPCLRHDCVSGSISEPVMCHF